MLVTYNIVYANMCIFLYSLIQCYIVYMKHVSMVCVSKSHIPHMYASQAKSFSYSLPFIHEHPMLINKSTTMHK